MRLRRITAVCMTTILLMNLIGCSVESTKGTVENVSNKACETASSAKEAVVDWYSNLDLTKFQEGWDYSVEFLGAKYSATMSSEYIGNVQVELNNLKNHMNASYGSARGTAQEAGFLAEKWAADTFNIDAAARGSGERANVVGSSELGSVDVETTYGENASLKYYKDASGSASAQARTILETYYEYRQNATGEPMELNEYLNKHGYDENMPMDELYASIYEGQTRIIPSDQMADAVKYLRGQSDKITLSSEGNLTDAQIAVYEETLNNLKDRLQAPDGTESRPLTYEEIQAIAEVSKEGEFKPEDFNVSLSTVISPKYIVKQSIGTGVEVAAINTALTVGPDIYSILKEAAVTGIIDEDALSEAGVEGAIAASEGFVEGSVSQMVAILCQTGTFGEALKSADPSVVATLTVVIIEGAIHGYELSQGKITAEEYGNMMVDRVMVSLLALPTSALFLAILPGTHIAMMCGCLAGGMVASIGYLMAKEAVFEIVDGGGFEAIVPVEAKNTFSIASDKIASLNIQNNISSFTDTCISTTNDGLIKIQSLVGD